MNKHKIEVRLTRDQAQLTSDLGMLNKRWNVSKTSERKCVVQSTSKDPGCHEEIETFKSSSKTGNFEAFVRSRYLCNDKGNGELGYSWLEINYRQDEGGQKDQLLEALIGFGITSVLLNRKHIPIREALSQWNPKHPSNAYQQMILQRVQKAFSRK